MISAPVITISGRVYRRNPDIDRYQIPIDELGELRMGDIPPHSHVEVRGIPVPRGAFGQECYGLNNGDSLSVYGGASFGVTPEERSRMTSRLRRAFPDMDLNGNGSFGISVEPVRDGLLAHVYIGLDFTDKPDVRLCDAVAPFVDGYERLNRPGAHVFICHASEDKLFARSLASAMVKLGAEVWFDEWEIKVGDSIVQKINTALGTISHLIVLLSSSSVARPWVQKELSSVLMRQLARQSVTVLPVRLDDCEIPPILADIRYADARKGIDSILIEIERALFSEVTET